MKKILFLSIGVFLLMLTACDIKDSTSSYAKEQTNAESSQSQMVRNQPAPKVSTSLERANVIKRAQLFNTENKISYIYLVNYGRVMAFYTVKGKVSSLRSYLNPPERLVKWDGSPCPYSTDYCWIMEAPEIDGTYGDNVPGIFFFTTEGAYVEWNGEYMLADQPLQLVDKPVLVREIK